MGRTVYRGLVPAAVFSAVLVAILSYNPVDSHNRLGNPHITIPCSDCHTQTADIGGRLDGDLDFGRTCRGCHSGRLARGTGYELSFHTESDRLCGDCHSFHYPERLSARGREFLFAYENRQLRALCAACHARRERLDRLSDGHREAAQLFHVDFRFLGGLTASEACLICHSDNPGRRPDQGLASPASVVRFTPRFDAHGSHPVGVRVVGGQGEPGNRIHLKIDSRLMLADGRIECTTCHSLSSSSAYHLAGISNRSDLCRGCHDVE